MKISSKLRLITLCVISSQAVIAAPLPQHQTMEIITDSDRYPNFTPICAHRGVWIDNAENTLASFQKAAEEDIECVEIDVKETADGILFLFHDRNVNRLLTDAKGNPPSYVTPGTAVKAESLTMSQLKPYYLRNRAFAPVANGANKVEEVNASLLNDIINLGLVINMDAKTNNTETFSNILKLAKEQNLLDKIIFKGRYWYSDYIAEINKANKKLPTGKKIKEGDFLYTPIVDSNVPYNAGISPIDPNAKRIWCDPTALGRQERMHDYVHEFYSQIKSTTVGAPRANIYNTYEVVLDEVAAHGTPGGNQHQHQDPRHPGTLPPNAPAGCPAKQPSPDALNQMMEAVNYAVTHSYKLANPRTTDVSNRANWPTTRLAPGSVAGRAMIFDSWQTTQRGVYGNSGKYFNADPSKTSRGDWDWARMERQYYITSDRAVLLKQYLTALGQRKSPRRQDLPPPPPAH